MRPIVRLACLFLVAGCGAPPDGPPSDDAARVDPFIGSGGLGFNYASCFVGAAAPNGLAKVGPDTTSAKYGALSFLHFSGYFHDDDTIAGFSHLHLHGTGATDYGVLALMPTDAFDPSRETSDGYASKFDKASEKAEPGYYAVTLARGSIGVELTATAHAAHHRYTWPSSASTGQVILDLDKHLSGGTITAAELHLDAASKTIRGRLHSVGGMSGGFGGYDVFFTLRARDAWTGAQLWHDGGAPAAATDATGKQVGAALAFDLSTGKTVELEVGLSLVSQAGADANLAAELPSFDFDGERAAARANWQKVLDRIKVAGGTDAERAIFATAMYHSFLMPTVVADADGTYMGQDGKPHAPPGFRYLSDMSLWDTYRTLHPLYATVAPDVARDAARSLAAMATDAGHFSRWPLATGDSGSMVGASADVVLADAVARGVDVDAKAAWALLRAEALDATPPPGGRGPREPYDPYAKLGYVPSSKGGSVSITMEFAQDDFALANLARAVGADADADALLARSHGWRQLFDPATGFLWAKTDTGAWAGPHDDPITMGMDFVEANAWQTVWGAPHDPDGLAMLFGGNQALVDRLSMFFELSKKNRDDDAHNTGAPSLPRPYYWAANEPDIHAAYLFAEVGRPDLTQQWARWALLSFYGTGPDGVPGNDDGGTMSSWWVWSALGLYPLVGTDRFIVGSPLFHKAEIAVAGGTFTIEAPAASDATPYVQAVTLDGKPLAQPVLHQSDLHAGGVLHFDLGPSPGAWGRM